MGAERARREPFTVNISPESRQKLRELADEYGVSTSVVVRACMSEAFGSPSAEARLRARLAAVRDG